MTEQTNETQWFIAREGKQHGPLTEIEMRTFVSHNYLRPTDLIWRPGMPEWLVATLVFPQVFQSGQQGVGAAPQPTPPPAAKPAPAPSKPTPSQNERQFTPARDMSAPPYGGTSTSNSDMSFGAHGHLESPRYESVEDPPAPRRGAKRFAIAATALAVIGGGAFALANYHEPLSRYMGSSTSTSTADNVEVPKISAPADPAPSAASVAATPAAPTDPAGVPGLAVDAPGQPSGFQTAALPPEPSPQPPPSIEGSKIDEKLQKIPAWVLIKSDYKDWYVSHIAAAEKLVADKKPDSEVALHLAQGLVTLRRQHAQSALAASPEKLENIAKAFLETLRTLRAQSVSACYGFISKGEASPAIVQLMEQPETATTFNNQVQAIFEAIAEGKATPVTNEAAVKADYDVLIKELGKLGWKEEDLQVFSNPRLLSQREPEQVCKMVQDWFVAHLAVQEATARKRLLFETLKPVVSG